MPGLAPRLPLEIDPLDGYGLIKNYRGMINQNLKMVLLTIPGERVMDPDFGVGLKTYLFEPQITQTHANLSANIRRQVAKYLPFIKITNIKFQSSEDSEIIPPNYLSVVLSFRVDLVDLSETLVITVTNN
jgi:uncharacterized protein